MSVKRYKIGFRVDIDGQLNHLWDSRDMVMAADLDALEAQKDGAYEERNQCVALIARMVIEAGGLACKTKTAIEGWSEDWHGCVYIQLPTGQVSWHYHTSHAWMFKDLPDIDEKWDGHDTPEKYRRVNAAFASSPAPDYDPTPWCSGCGAMRKTDCHCGPIAENE